MRAQFMGLIDALSPGYPAPSTAVRTDEGSLGPVKYCIYTPTNLPQSSDDASKPLLPVGVYYHPGGLVIGPSAYDAVLCRALAEAAGCIIVSVQYRLSPENKAPAHLDDALSAFEWVSFAVGSPASPPPLTLDHRPIAQQPPLAATQTESSPWAPRPVPVSP